MPDNESPIYVTDTHSLIWYLTDSPKLSFAANSSFREIEEGKAKLLIPAMLKILAIGRKEMEEGKFQPIDEAFGEVRKIVKDNLK